VPKLYHRNVNAILQNPLNAPQQRSEVNIEQAARMKGVQK
jgi:hypothetical protein